ncbi:hypothetical protein D3C87_1726440 [compost metagenome]
MGIVREQAEFSVVVCDGVTPASLSRKCESAGIKTRAPSMFQTNMKVRRMPMSAWNLMGDQAQVMTPAARVTPTRATTLPVKLTATA